MTEKESFEQWALSEDGPFMQSDLKWVLIHDDEYRYKYDDVQMCFDSWKAAKKFYEQHSPA